MGRETTLASRGHLHMPTSPQIAACLYERPAGLVAKILRVNNLDIINNIFFATVRAAVTIHLERRAPLGAPEGGVHPKKRTQRRAHGTGRYRLDEAGRR